ncbi:MAG: PAS domain S-box protein [Thermodesulfobacteriota bacterium]
MEDSRDATARDRLRILETAIQASIEAIALGDLQGRLTQVNPAFLRLWGYDDETQVLGRSSLEFWRDPGAAQAVVRALWAGGSWRGGLTGVRRDGGEIEVEVSATLVRDEGENPLCLLASFADVTERNRADRELRESEGRYRSIVDASPWGILQYRLEPGDRLVFAGGNPAADAILGIRCAARVGKTIEEAFPPLAATAIPGAYREVARTGRPWASEHVTYEDERISGVYAVRAFRVAPGELAVAFEDITERRSAEDHLRASAQRIEELYRKAVEQEELYRSLLRSIPDPVALYDLEGNAVYLNPSFTETFGFTAEEMVGRRIPFVPEAEAPGTAETIRQVLAGQPCRGFETRRLARDGRILDVVLSSSVYHDHRGKAAGIVVVLRDVTRSRQVEHQLLQAQKLEAVGTLASGIAHDFNNLLQAITGYAELSLAERPEGRTARFLAGIEEAARRGSDLVKNLLAFSRAGQPRRHVVDLGAEVRRIAEILERTFPKMIRIRQEGADHPVLVWGDPAQLEQVLLNLATNARDAMPDGGTLTFRLETLAADSPLLPSGAGPPAQRWVLLAVSDTGRGMAPEVAEHAFEPFYTTKGVGQGTGLGLYSTYGIVQRHGGHLTFETAQGRGTAFRLLLPAAEAPDVAPAPEDPAAPAAGREATVLVADDDPAVVEVVADYLDHAGYRVLTARSGEEALAVFGRNPEAVDLVLLDLGMPGMGGRKCLRQLLRIRPAARVLVASGYSPAEHAEATVEEGAAGFVGKPYRLRELGARIRETLASPIPPSPPRGRGLG